MNLMGSSYAPEIFMRLIKEGLELYESYALCKIGRGVLTLNEIGEDIVYWKDRVALFCEDVGWDSKLIKILDN